MASNCHGHKPALNSVEHRVACHSISAEVSVGPTLYIATAEIVLCYREGCVAATSSVTLDRKHQSIDVALSDAL